MIILFSLNLGWLPSSGMHAIGHTSTGDLIKHAILPTLVLSVNNTAVFVRYIRANTIEQMEEDYVMTAVSKGVPQFQVMKGHVLKNCLLPIITMVGMNFGTLITGSFVVESVFGWPGLGTLCMSAINSRDYTMIMGITMLACVVLLIGNFLAETLYGGRISLLVGFAAMCVAVIVGTLFGTISGYMGGAVDAFMMRIVDVFMSVPSLLFIIVVYAFMPRNLVTLVGMLAFFSWTKVARVVRAQTLTLKERDFVIAAKALGVSQGTIIRKHIIPNLMPQIIVSASLSIANAILDDSTLSFLGYGVQLPMASWGSMLQTAQKFILHNPIMAVAPGVMILVTVLCFNVLGDMLQQMLDPKLVK